VTGGLIQPSPELWGEFVLCATSCCPWAISRRRWTLIKIHRRSNDLHASINEIKEN